MGRAPCCDKANVKKGPWSPEEDAKLKDYIHKHGTGGNWIALPHKIGLKRCGKSCRLRWLNYLRPNIKHGEFSDDEDRKICSLFATIGSRWSIIAAHLPGRTDNDIKNYWNTKLKKKLFGTMASSNKQYQKIHHQSANSPFPYSLNNFSPQSPSFPAVYNQSPFEFAPIRSFSRGFDPISPNFQTLISPIINPNYNPVQYMDHKPSGSSTDGSCITNQQMGYDQNNNLCCFPSAIDENQKFLAVDFGCSSNGGFGDEIEIETPLDDSIEEIKQLITTDTNLNCFTAMDEIKTEFDSEC